MTGSHQTAALLLAAGSGKRMQPVTKGRNKVFLELGGVPLFVHPLRTLCSSEHIDRVVLVHREEDREEIEKILTKESLELAVECVVGGKHRFESAYNGLQKLAERPPEIVVIQDSARVFLTDAMIETSVEKAREHGAATVAIPLTDTVKRVQEGFFVETIPRDKLFRIQTPQTFRFDRIWEAHQRFRMNPDSSVTDDCMLLERRGDVIALVMGDETNLKVTTPLDLKLAEILLQEMEKRGL